MFFFVFSFQKGSNPTFCTKILSYDNNQRSVWEALSKKFTGRSAAVDKNPPKLVSFSMFFYVNESTRYILLPSYATPGVLGLVF